MSSLSHQLDPHKIKDEVCGSTPHTALAAYGYTSVTMGATTELKSIHTLPRYAARHCVDCLAVCRMDPCAEGFMCEAAAGHAITYLVSSHHVRILALLGNDAVSGHGRLDDIHRVNGTPVQYTAQPSSSDDPRGRQLSLLAALVLSHLALHHLKGAQVH